LTIKALCKKFGVNGSLSVDNHSLVRLTLHKGKLDFVGNYNANNKHRYDAEGGYIQVNHYHLDSHFKGDVLAFLTEANAILNQGNHNRSDVMSDYFDVGWYVNIHVGKWNKPYALTV
jgi:ABC-type phosphate transport system auxiliary subunit